MKSEVRLHKKFAFGGAVGPFQKQLQGLSKEEALWYFGALEKRTEETAGA